MLRHLAADIESGAVDVVLIHDAARPLASPAMMDTAVTTARASGGAIPVLPRQTWSRPTRRPTVAPRRHAGPGPDPAGVSRRPLLAAYLAAADGSFEGTDTASCVQNYTDLEVHVFPGAATNLKVTFAPDVRLAERLLQDRISRSGTR